MINSHQHHQGQSFVAQAQEDPSAPIPMSATDQAEQIDLRSIQMDLALNTQQLLTVPLQQLTNCLPTRT